MNKYYDNFVGQIPVIDTKKFLVIDGSSLLVTNYYATLPRDILMEKDPVKKKEKFPKIMHTSTGLYTNAIYGTLRTILKIIKYQKPDYLAVVFDKSRDTFRRQIDSSYKANRKPTDEPLKEQFIGIENILEELGIVTLYDDTYEADDLAGSIIKTFEGPSIQMRFLTKDHDYLQLISEYTRGWMVQPTDDKLNELYDKYGDNEKVNEWISSATGNTGSHKDLYSLPDKVYEFTDDIVIGEEGVHAWQIADLKGIKGDTADNIKGVKGVSAPAATLLLEYGTIEGLYEAIEDCKSPKEEKELVAFWKEHLGITRSPFNQLKGAKDDALTSKKLATIVTTAPVPENINDYTYNINQSILLSILEKYEFKSLIKEYC